MAHPFLPNADDATISDQAEPDSVDFDTLVAAHAVTGVVSGCVTSESAAPGMKVDVTAGVVRYQGKPITVAGATDEAITAADGSNLRIDLVSVNASGTVVVTDGTPAANAVAPAIPATSVPLAFVYVPASDTTIADNQIVDKRVTVPDNAGVYHVYWYGATGDGVADDTAEIQAAIDAADTGGGGIVLFGADDYLVTGTLDFYDNITLQGSNRGETRIVMTGTNTVLTNATPGTRIFHVFVNDIQFYTAAGTPSVVVDWHSVSLGGMNRVMISGFQSSTALRLTATSSGDTIWNSFTDVHVASANIALLLTGSAINQNRFYACQFSGKASGGTGILIEDGNNNSFTNCSSETGQVGLEMTATTNGFGNTFYSHRFEGNTDGIKISGSACRRNVFRDTYFSTVTNNWSNTSGWANNLISFRSIEAAYAQIIDDEYEVLYDSGSPEGVMTAPIGSYYIRTDGGVESLMYLKTSGVGNTGWDVVHAGSAINGAVTVGDSATTERVAFGTDDVKIYDGDNALRIEVLNGGDIVLYDEDGTTARLTWDEGATRWVINSDLTFAPWTSTDIALIDTTSVDDEFRLSIIESGVATRYFLVGYGPAHATSAGDIIFASPSDANQLLKWDESGDRWETAKTFRANVPTRYTTTQTLTEADHLVNADGSAFTVTLPDVATVVPHAILIFAGGSGNITIDPAGSDQIDGSGTSKVLTGGETPPAAIGLVCYNVTDDWETVSEQGTVT